MTDYLNIGSTPPEEDCIGVGRPGAQEECSIYKRQLTREFPEGEFRVKGFEHDFGRYYEVVAMLGDEAQEEAAYAAEGEASPVWDEQAKVEMKLLKERYA